MASPVCREDLPAAPPGGAERGALLALRNRGDIYRFLHLGYGYLAAVGDDPGVAFEVLKGLIELGLGGPARELLHQRPDLDAARPETAELRRHLKSVPIGRVLYLGAGGTGSQVSSFGSTRLIHSK